MPNHGVQKIQPDACRSCGTPCLRFLSQKSTPAWRNVDLIALHQWSSARSRCPGEPKFQKNIGYRQLCTDLLWKMNAYFHMFETLTFGAPIWAKQWKRLSLRGTPMAAAPGLSFYISVSQNGWWMKNGRQGRAGLQLLNHAYLKISKCTS